MPRLLGLVTIVTLLALTPNSLPGQVPACQTGCTGTYSVDVTPDGLHKGRLTGSQYVDTFLVTNSGTATDVFTFTCSVSGSLSCVSVSPGSATLVAEQLKKVVVTYSVSGPGTVTLTAAGHASDPGTILISTEPTITIVAPVLTSGSRAVVRTRQPLLRATYLPHGAGIDTTETVLSWKRGSTTDTVSTLARANRGLLEWEVDSTHWLAVGDSGQMTVKVCSLESVCATASRWAVLPNDSAAVLGFTGVPLEALGRQFGAPFGPGLAVSGGEVETGVGIPAYVSMGAGHSAGLVYSTRQSYPRALVPIDLELTWPTGTPDQIKVILYDGATKLDSLSVTSPTCATGSARRCRLVLQGDFSGSSFSTPTRKWLTVEARVTSGATTKTATDSVEVVLVDRRTTIYGSGWWPSGAVKLVAAGSDRVLVGSGGTAAVYRGTGDSLYLSPPGDFSTLVKTGSGWEIHPRGSLAKLVFDSNGRLSESVDASGNRDSIAYSGSSDQVTAFVDPVGKTITLGYDGNGNLSTWTDPAGRQSRVSIDNSSRQLTYDSVASATSRPFTARFVYQTYGTATLVLTKRIGVIADTTIVTYDSTFRRRPALVSLPAVDTGGGGASVRPVITYTAYERQGFGALRSLDSIYVELKDPRNNWTRSLLNRWGEALKTWDALGTIGRSAYTAEGFVLWSEGKVADSSRVYHAYDALGRPVKSYIVRGASDVLRLDSLIYDANSRVSKTIGLIGDTSRVTYDSLGRVLYAITPANDTTKFWYRSDGLLDSTRLPGVSVSRRFGYDGTWKNVLFTRDESGLTTDSALVDDLGRDTLHVSKLHVQVTATTSQWQWRKVRTYISVAGQVDSTVLFRTDNCADPCNSPPSWPSASDTVRTQRVGYRFDRAGRDSLRLNDRGKAVLYLYDRLGRPVSRYPWTDSMAVAVRDSFVYDVAGNVKRTITRRGDTLTASFDSRNRDTLSVIPGVGTQRKVFGGPGDQLTRLWYDSPVDSIGGVNAERRWGFDQSGRLKADTSYTGSIARATTYTYDSQERRSTSVDALGTWTLRYEAARGYADTLLTPLGDTITYTFDARGRAVGPTLAGGGPAEAHTPSWNAAGALRMLTHTVSTTPNSFLGGKWDRNAFPDEPTSALGPLWTEQHGAGATADSLQDSLVYDGWERLTVWVGLKNGSVAARDTFAFDRTGNIKTTAGAEGYDVTTDRLTSTTGCSSFSYDRAGNLVSRTCAGNTWSYQYDALNRLRSARYNGTLIVRYAYDVLGQRIAKRVYSNATGGTVAYTRFVYRGGGVGFETDSGGVLGLRYEYGLEADDLLAIQDTVAGSGKTVYYTVQDLLHSIRGLVKRDGTWERSLRYGPYGAVAADTANRFAPTWALRYRWTGREYDSETGFYFFRARYYDPSVRRFVQEDPIGFAGGSNVYAYGDGNPLDGRDPAGTDKNCDYGACTPRYWIDGCLSSPCGDASQGGGGGDDWGFGSFSDFANYSWNSHRYGQEAAAQIDECFQRGRCDDVWKAYQNNFGTALGNAIRDIMSAPPSPPVDQRAYAQMVLDGTRSLKRWQFDEVVDVARFLYKHNSSAVAVTLMGWLLNGQMGINEAVENYERSNATYLQNGGFTFVAAAIFQASYGFDSMGQTLFHEAMHELDPNLSDQELDIRACTAFPAASRCH